MDVEMHKEDIMSKSSCGGFSWAAGTWECPERAVGQASRLSKAPEEGGQERSR